MVSCEGWVFEPPLKPLSVTPSIWYPFMLTRAPLTTVVKPRFPGSVIRPVVLTAPGASWII